MKYFKMELRNREQNFNQVFGGGPNVGVMSVGSAAKVGQAANKVRTLPIRFPTCLLTHT